MSSTKLRINVLWLVVLYVGTIALFGLPYTNKKIVEGTSYSKAIEEAGFPKILYSIRRFVLIIGNIFAVSGCIMIFSEGHLIKYFDYYRNRKYITNMIWFTIGAYASATIVQLVFAAMSFAIMKNTQNASLKEFARADFVWLIGMTILAAYCLYSQFEWRSYLKSWKKS